MPDRRLPFWPDRLNLICLDWTEEVRLSTWKLEDAKNQFSRLVREARQHGPQVVTRHGNEEVVVIAVEEYRRLASARGDFVAFMRASPLAEALKAGELELLRSRDLPRDIPL